MSENAGLRRSRTGLALPFMRFRFGDSVSATAMNQSGNGFGLVQGLRGKHTGCSAVEEWPSG